MRALAYRICLTMINIFFPPLSVMLLCGASWDCMMNCILFLCGVLPSHVHGFYISCTYFNRRKKVKKGRYPGGPKSMIHSDNVINGGASNATVDELWRKENGLERKSSHRDASRKNSMRRTESQKPYIPSRQDSKMMQRQNSDMVQRKNSNMVPRRQESNLIQRHGSNIRRMDTTGSRGSNREFGTGGYDGRYFPNEADGYGPGPARTRTQGTGYSAGTPISPSSAREHSRW